MGQQLTNQVVVSNLGPATAPGVTLAVSIPPATTLVSASSSAGTCYQSGGTIYCVPGDLTNGQTFTLTAAFTPNVFGAATNTATVRSTSR